MINNNLLNGVASLLAGGSYTIPSYLAFGSTSGLLTAADIVTSGEFDRNALTGYTVSNNTTKFNGTRLSTEASNETVNIISLTNSGTLRGSNDIQVSFLVPSLLHTTSFDLNVEVWVTVNRG
jgi:hypothetical protein